MRSDGRLRIFPQREGKRQGDIQHGLDRKAWQPFFLGEFGRIDRIHYGMADVEAGAPVILLHPAAEGHVPLSCATSTAVEKNKIFSLLGTSHHTIGKAFCVQRCPSANAGAAIEHQMLSNQLGLSSSRDRGAEILWAPKDFECGLQAFVQRLVAAWQEQDAIGMTTAELGA